MGVAHLSRTTLASFYFVLSSCIISGSVQKQVDEDGHGRGNHLSRLSTRRDRQWQWQGKASVMELRSGYCRQDGGGEMES